MSQAYIARIKSAFRSKDPKVVARLKAQNEALAALRQKGLVGSVHQDATLSNLSIQYKNEDYIGTQLMPVVSVPKLSDKWYTYSKRDRLAGPDDRMGSRSRPNEITENRTASTYACESFGLSNFVSVTDIKNQDAPLNEMVDLTASVNDVLDLKEELRIATVVTTAGNYPTGNKVTLAGGDQWNAATSEPIKHIQTAIDACWMGMGATKLVGWCGNDVFRALQRHPSIGDLTKYTQAGLNERQALANILGLDELLVGKARNDTANEGQTAVYDRIYGKFFGVTRVARNPSPRCAAFGFTLRFLGERVTSIVFDDMVGTRGGYYSKVGMDEVHQITASDTAYLISAAIA